MSVVSKAAACVAFAAVALILPVALQAAAPAPAGAAIVPPQNPGANISPAPGYSGPCGGLSAPNPYCPSGLTLIYGDRQAEGISPMSLPSNYPSLTPPEQLFVLTDLERIDRGLPPIAGLAANLNAYAQAGANAHTDPPLPTYGTVRSSHLLLHAVAGGLPGHVDVRRRAGRHQRGLPGVGRGRVLGPPGHHPRLLRRSRPHGGGVRPLDDPALRRG